MTKGGEGNIVSFAQDAEFHLRRSKRFLEKNDYPHAVQAARKAYAQKPKNAEIAVNLAEILNRMMRFEESNRVLLLIDPDNFPRDALFGIASNYIALEEFYAAKGVLELYLKNNPDGVFSADAEEYLDLLWDDDEICSQLGLTAEEDCFLVEAVHKAKLMQAAGLRQQSLDSLMELEKEYSKSLYLQMEIAVALFSLRRYEEAERRIFGIFKRDLKHIRANCLLAMLYHIQNRDDEAREVLSRVSLRPDADTDEISSLATAYLQLDELEKAEPLLDRLTGRLPYDPQSLHLMGYCKYMLNKRDKAEELYRLLLTIDEGDSVAKYYLDIVLANKPADKQDWMLNYEVSARECIKRMRYIMSAIANEELDSIEIWRADERLRELIRWSVHSGVMLIWDSVVEFLGEVGNEEAEQLLRTYLMLPNKSDESKHLVFALLRKIGAKEPYAVHLNDGFQPGMIKQLEFSESLPVAYQMIMEQLLEPPTEVKLPDNASEVALRIFHFYIKSLNGSYPKISVDQETALAAAIMLMSLHSLQNETTPEEVCEMYQITMRRLNNALQKIFQRLGEPDGENE
ncbi:MAG: tetratricopeptide repeat protein [Clostridia bacterium]|nr:tetratricopeptide repeat protein [Clostridia bacterium]